MTNWSFKKVQGDQINVNNYIISVFFDTLTEYSNYLAYNKGNPQQKRLVISGINALYFLLKFYKAVRKGDALADKKLEFDRMYEKIKESETIEDKELHLCVDFISEAMFLTGFTDINWEFKDYEKSL